MAPGHFVDVVGTRTLAAQPWTPVIGYLVDVRPLWPERSLFLTLRAPIRPLRTSALSEIAPRRLDRLGLKATRRGARVLRHPATQHLLDHA